MEMNSSPKSNSKPRQQARDDRENEKRGLSVALVPKDARKVLKHMPDGGFIMDDSASLPGTKSAERERAPVSIGYQDEGQETERTEIDIDDNPTVRREVTDRLLSSTDFDDDEEADNDDDMPASAPKAKNTGLRLKADSKEKQTDVKPSDFEACPVKDVAERVDMNPNVSEGRQESNKDAAHDFTGRKVDAVRKLKSIADKNDDIDYSKVDQDQGKCAEVLEKRTSQGVQPSASCANIHVNVEMESTNVVKFELGVLTPGDDLETLIRKIVGWANPCDAKEKIDIHGKKWKEKLANHEKKFESNFQKFVEEFGLVNAIGDINIDKVKELFKIKAQVEIENFEKCQKIRLGIFADSPGMTKFKRDRGIAGLPAREATGRNDLFNRPRPSISVGLDDDLSLDLSSGQYVGPGLRPRSREVRQNVKTDKMKFNPEVLESDDDLETLVRKVVDWANQRDGIKDDGSIVKIWKVKLSYHHKKFKLHFERFKKEFGLGNAIGDVSEMDRVMELFKIQAQTEMMNLENRQKIKLGIPFNLATTRLNRKTDNSDQ